MHDQYFWNECKKTLEKDLPVEEYSTWIAPLALEENSGSNPPSYTVLSPNRFISDWVEQNYKLSIEERLGAITSKPEINVAFGVSLGDSQALPKIELEESPKKRPTATNQQKSK